MSETKNSIGNGPESEKNTIKYFLSDRTVRKVFDTMNIGVLITNSDFTIAYVNDAICRLVSMEKEKILGSNILDLFTKAEQRELAGEILEKRSRGTSSLYEFKITDDDGKNVILLGSGTPIMDDESNFTGALALYVDITDQKDTERELERLKKFNENIIENIPSGIAVLDESLQILSANKTFLGFSGRSRPEVVGEKFSDIFPFELLKNKNFLRNLLDTLDGEETKTVENIHFKLDGSDRIAVAKLKTIDFGGERGKKLLLILDDVTEISNLQKELIQSQRMDSIGRLAGGVAHDFNNLLGGILGYASLMRNDLSEGTEMRKNLDMIIQSAERASDLTKQLLTFASGKAAEQTIFDPVRVIKDVVELLSATIDRSIEIDTFFDPYTSCVVGNETNFQQAILNICINARDAMENGGKIKIATSNTTLDESSTGMHTGAAPGDYVLISISDTGKGMDAETKRRIFEPFFSTKERKERVGLGLSIVYGTIKNMGGFINVESSPQMGTHFALYIPASTEKEKKESTETMFSTLTGTEYILVVDDEEVIRDLSTRILTSAGYRVITAEDGKKALTILKEESDSIDLVVLDLIMPHMSGGTAFKKIRELIPNMPVIISTGYSPGDSAADILKHNGTDFLQKPFFMNDMLRKVRRMLDETKAKR
ncbi:hypothetical protein DRQ05_01080 [bacterium]|nr:MAG: hypothetical protein DRQ05_01080 [bacterium]